MNQSNRLCLLKLDLASANGASLHNQVTDIHANANTINPAVNGHSCQEGHFLYLMSKNKYPSAAIKTRTLDKDTSATPMLTASAKQQTANKAYCSHLFAQLAATLLIPVFLNV